MTTHRSHDISSEPLAGRPNRELDLMDGDRRYGWIAGNRIGFVGFGNHVEAVQAAWVAHRTAMRRVASGTSVIADEPGTLALTSRDGDEVILANGEPIAVLVRPRTDDATGPESFGFEIRMPSPADELTVRATAYRIYRALKSSGVPWALRRGNIAPASQRHERGSPVTDRPVATVGSAAITDDAVRTDAFDQSRQRARRFLRMPWRRKRRSSTRELVERRVR